MRHNDLTTNVFWNFLGQGWGLLLALLATPFIVHRLGSEAYGLLALSGVVASYFGFLGLGLESATVKYVAEHYKRGEMEEIRRVFWASLLAYLVLGTIGGASIVAAAPLCVHRLFRMPPHLVNLALIVLYLSGLGFALGMVMGVLNGVLRALHRFDIVNQVGAVVGTTQTLSAVLFLATGFSLREIVLGNLVVQGLAGSLYWVIIRRLLPGLSRPVWHASTFWKLLRFGGYVTISGVVGPVLVHVEKLLVVRLVSMGALTYYSVSYNLVGRLSIFPSCIAGVLFPTFSSMEGTDERGRLGEIHLRSTKYIVALLLPVTVFLVVFAREFLQFWLGVDFAEQGTMTLQILAVAVLINAAAWSSYMALQALGRPDLPAKFHLLELLIHVPLSYWLIASWGITGAAAAWTLRVGLDTTLLLVTSVQRTGLSLGEMLRGIIANRGLMAMVLVIPPLYVLKSLFLFPEGRLAVGGTATALYGLGVVWTLFLDNWDRAFVRERVREFRSKLRILHPGQT